MLVIKTIKFDLPIDGIKVRNIEELRDHFTMEIIDLYHNGILSKWLRSRNMTEELAALEDIYIDSSDHFSLLKSMCEIFKIEVDDQIISVIFNEAQSKSGSSIKEVKSNKKSHQELISKIDQLFYYGIALGIFDASIVKKNKIEMPFDFLEENAFGKERYFKFILRQRKNLLSEMAESVQNSELSNLLFKKIEDLNITIDKIPDLNKMDEEYIISNFSAQERNLIFFDLTLKPLLDNDEYSEIHNLSNDEIERRIQEIAKENFFLNELIVLHEINEQ